MDKIIPTAEGRKINYKFLEGFPEKTEMIDGDLLWSDNEKKAVLLTILANSGIAFLVDVLPDESIEQLKQLIEKREQTL